MKRILVTSALPYANGPIHLGHLAGAYLPADVFVRYHRLKGSDVVYICGSDEHGAAIVKRAMTDGVSPREIVDRYHVMAEKDFAAFGMSFDHYGRTSSPMHHLTAREWFVTIKDCFHPQDGGAALRSRREALSRGPLRHGNLPALPIHAAPTVTSARAAGTALSPKDLSDPKSTLSDATPEWRETTHWYLPMGEHQARLEKWIGEKTHWKANVLGQIKSWFTIGLGERAMTRDLPWGVPVPENVAKERGRRPGGQGPLRLVRRADRVRLGDARVGRERRRPRALEDLLASPRTRA